MEISSEKVLNKMSTLIQQAKQAKSTEEMGRCISSIQTLCELLVEVDCTYEDKTLSISNEIKKSVLQSAVVKTDTGHVVKIDDANGNSLLDF